MSIISNPYTFVPNTLIQSAQVNADFSTIYNDYNGNITNANIAPGAAIDPAKIAGGLIPTGVPTGWALCNGQTTTWITGPNAGMPVTLPNMIGMFVQGSDVTGGSSTPNANGFGSATNQTQVGTATHTHMFSGTTGGPSNANVLDGAHLPIPDGNHTHNFSGTTAATNTQPPSYAIPWIIKL
jgi:hypothetical protein